MADDILSMVILEALNIKEVIIFAGMEVFTFFPIVNSEQLTQQDKDF